MWNELADTLIALVRSVQAPAESGVVVTEAHIEIPLEVGSVVRKGQLIFCGAPPHSRWQSGVLPPVHLGRLHVALDPTDAPAFESGGRK